MSLYRQPGQARRRRRLALALGAGAVLVVAVVVVLLARGGGPPTQAQRTAAARAAATEALDGLELLGIEYRQAVRDGRVVAPTEYQAAKADVQRARDVVRSHDEDLAAVDPAAPGVIGAALRHVAEAVDRRVDGAQLRRAMAPASTRLSAIAAGAS